MGASSAEILDQERKLAVSRKPLFLHFTDVRQQDLQRIASAGSRSEIRRILQECMDIDEEPGFRTEILADLHYHNYSFCVSRKFTPIKTSCLLSIVKRMLDEALRKRLDAERVFDICKELLLKHSVERPPWSVGIFSFEDAKAIMDYLHNGFFRHYRLYMYAFLPHCDLTFSVDGARRCALPPVMRPPILRPADEVVAREQPELRHLFGPTEAELAAAEAARRAASGEDERSQLIKRKVEEGVKRLMEQFEQKVKDQDDHFKQMLSKG